MRQRFNTRQRNYIILGLCSILLVMAAGYAAFRSQLTINGTSNITSDWKVLITDIQSSVLAGDATDAEAPTHTETTATFKTNLVSPGDSMQYDITVENQGNIDAKLDKITVPESNNPAIRFEVTGIREGSLLKKGNTALLTVVVTYNPEVTNQPDNLTADFTVTLDYSQAPNGYVEPLVPTIGGQEVDIVTTGDGLYEDSYEAGRLIYRGQNPNNYIMFNDELWRIIAKETDGTYKIIRNDVLEDRAFDEANHRSTEKNSYCQNTSGDCGVYAAVEGEFSTPDGAVKGTVTEDSSIKIYLNDDYYVNNINNTAKEQMTSHTFNIGAVEDLSEGTDNIEKNIAGEKMYTWIGKVGLANVSDLLRASTNPLCTSATYSFDSQRDCNSNYLLSSTDYAWYWTINAYYKVTEPAYNRVWRGFSSSDCSAVVGTSNAAHTSSPRPVVYLTSSLSLGGSGTISDPFTIMN